MATTTKGTLKYRKVMRTPQTGDNTQGGGSSTGGSGSTTGGNTGGSGSSDGDGDHHESLD